MHEHRNPRGSVSKRPILPDNHDAPTAGAVADARRPSRADFDTHVGGARLAIGRAEALTDALHRYFDDRNVTGADGDVSERRVSHLIDMAAAATVEAFEELDRASDALRSEDVA